jgi:hypothetical protein
VRPRRQPDRHRRGGQLRLAAEAPVDGRTAHAGALGDGLERESGEALLGQQLGGGAEERRGHLGILWTRHAA